MKSKALISVVKGDNKDLISKIYESPESFNHKDQLENGALHYAYCLGNVDAIMILQGIAKINPEKNSSKQLPLTLFPSDRNEEKKKLVNFGIGLNSMEPPQKFIHTFKNLSDEGKKQLFSKFLEHKKFPNSASELTPEELKKFFATFSQDEDAFQKLANLIREKPENQEFIALINGSDLLDKGFKDDLKFKSKTLAERLIVDFNSLNDEDERKALLTNILQNKDPKSLSQESSLLEDEDLKDFFKIFLRNKEYEELFDKFRDEDKRFENIRMQKADLIEPIHDELELEEFINFLNIFSSSDFQETSEEIKEQVENYVSDFKGESNLAFERAFDMPENHLALSNLYLNYPEEAKEIFTLEKLETLLRSDLEISQKQKLFFKALEVYSVGIEQESLISILFESRKNKNFGIISSLSEEQRKEIFDKLSAEKIVEILLEKPNFLHQGNNTFIEDATKLFFEDAKILTDYFLRSDRFSYDVKSNYLDSILQNNDYGIIKGLNKKKQKHNSIFIKNFSVEAIENILTQEIIIVDPELKNNLLSTALDSENIKNDKKIALLTALFATNDQEKLNLIYDYFLNKDLASTQELLTQEVVESLFKSNLNEEKKLDLRERILSYAGLDEELKANISSFLPAEFISSLSRDQETGEPKVEAQQRTDFSAKRVTQKSGSSSPDQNSSSPVEVASNESSDSNLGSSELTLSNTSSFSVIRVIVGSNSESTSPIEPLSQGSESPDGREAPNSPSITSATIGLGSSEPEISSAIAIVDNVLSTDDCEELQKILTGRVFGGFRNVRSYASEEFIPDSPLKIFNVNFKNTYPFGNGGLSLSDGKLKKKFHEDYFDKLLKKIHESNERFDQQRLKSYLYAILAISTGESDSIPSFFECYDHLIKNTREAYTVGPGHGSWIERPEDYVKLKIIINEMERIHDVSSKEGNPAFTEKNLHNWMRAQLQDRRIEEFNYLENKEFVENLIEASDDKSSDAKASELKIVKDYLKSFLDENTIFLKNLANISATGDNYNKGLANDLLDHLFTKMSSKNSSFGQVAKDTYDQQLIDLRENLMQKINLFKEKLSNGRLSELDTDDDHLILDLILEIPTKFDDILKAKSEGNRLETQPKIKSFTISLGSRESIFEFRKTCSEQADQYREIARELGASPAKSGPAR